MNTPTALLDLHFSGTVLAEEWLDQWDTKQTDCIWQWSREQAWAQKVRSMLVRLSEYEKQLSEHPKLKKEFADWVINSIGRLSVMEILKAMDFIKEWCSTLKETSEPVAFQCDSFLKDKLKGYDFKTDEDAPLGFKRTREDLCDNMIKSIKDKGDQAKVQLAHFLNSFFEEWEKKPDKEQHDKYQNYLYLAKKLTEITRPLG